MAKILEPLANNVPIVDPKTGNPTPYFMRILQRLSAGENITVGSDGSINVPPIPTSLDDLTDVDTTSTPPTDGQGLVFDDGSSLWVPGTVASSGGGMTPFQGCLVKKAANQTAANYTTPTAVTWDTEVYDTDGFHDTSSNTSRITIPSGVTKVRLSGQILIDSATVTSADYFRFQILKNGVAFDGIPFVLSEISSTGTSFGLNASSAIINVSAGDYFELSFTTEADASITVRADYSWFACQVIQSNSVVGNTFAGALVYKSANQTGLNFTTAAAITFDSELYDTLGFHSTSSNTSRLTIPSGVTKVRVHGQITKTNGTADTYAQLDIRKNGAIFLGYSRQASEIGAGQSSLVTVTPVVDVSAGDYFELFYTEESDASVDLVGGLTQSCTFSIEVVQGSQPYADTHFAGALVKKAADQTAFNATGVVNVTWDTDVYDTLGFHDTSSNTSRLTIPPGVTKVRVSGQLYIQLTTADTFGTVDILKNGAVFSGFPSTFSETGSGSRGFQCHSAIVEVSAGDYFELRYQEESDASITINAANSWFAIEVIEYTSPRTTTFSGAKVRKSAALTGQNLTTNPVIVFNTEDWDTDGYHDTVSNTERLTVSTGGKYQCIGQVDLTNATSGERAILTIERYNNASVLQETVCSQMASAGSTGVKLNVIGTSTFSAGDYIVLKINILADTSVDIGTASWFEIRRLEQ